MSANEDSVIIKRETPSPPPTVSKSPETQENACLTKTTEYNNSLPENCSSIKLNNNNGVHKVSEEQLNDTIENGTEITVGSKEKKPEIPVKSSMEILSELFSTFDAEPPVIVKKEKSEHKKHKKSKKKHKHKKKKDKKRKRANSESDEELEEGSLTRVVIKSEITSPKRIKTDEDEVKVKKGPEVEQREDSGSSTKTGKIVIKDLKFSSIFEATIREIKEKQEKDEHSHRCVNNVEEKKKRHKKKHHKHHKSESKVREKHRSRSRSSGRRKSDDEHSSWYQCRDRDYYRSRSKEDERERSRDRKHRIERKHRRRSSSRSSKERHRSREKDREKYHRERSASRESSSYIDKKKLLEIARRNAIQMMKSGSLPGALTLGPQAQEKVIAAIKAGGKTIEELTDFCKTLSRKEELGELSSVSEDNSSDSDNEKAFHHPFQIKDRPTSITMNIKNAIPLPTKTTQERTAELRMQFPVSSGQQHRKTETEWVPVPQKKPECKQTPAIVPKVAIFEPQVTPELVTAPTLAPPGPQVFPKQIPESNIDVGVIVSQRLAAIRRLQENPHDSQAISEMYRAQKEMQSWAESKQQPGQFTGSTGAHIMSQAELASGYQAWARKDQLQTAAPVSGGMGMHLLQKMGWKPGEGLGKEKRGALEPLLLEVKLDKKGLVAIEEQKRKQNKTKQKAALSMQGKHPVSLLGEYASKCKIGAPQYELCFECGPDHKKNFLFKVILNGVEYKPNVASPNKKEAKANAATVCLQHLGLLLPPL